VPHTCSSAHTAAALLLSFISRWAAGSQPAAEATAAAVSSLVGGADARVSATGAAPAASTSVASHIQREF
jgi:hypothetical protein